MNTSTTYAQRIAKLAKTPVTKAEMAAFKERQICMPASIDPVALFPELKAFHDGQFKGQLKIGRRHTQRVLSLEDASCVYQQLRDESGEDGSTFPDGIVTMGGHVYLISYNGKVWANLHWQSGDVPVFNPYTQQVAS